MTLQDSCQCGAKFQTRGWITANVIGAWAAWFNAHAYCRGGGTISVDFK